MSKMSRYYNNKYNVNIKMASMYNKNIQYIRWFFFFLVGHICIMDKDRQVWKDIQTVWFQQIVYVL
jgi:hypothetical protein